MRTLPAPFLHAAALLVAAMSWQGGALRSQDPATTAVEAAKPRLMPRPVPGTEETTAPAPYPYSPASPVTVVSTPETAPPPDPEMDRDRARILAVRRKGSVPLPQMKKDDAEEAVEPHLSTPSPEETTPLPEGKIRITPRAALTGASQPTTAK